MEAATLYRLAAFSDDPAGGNPAGVWIGEALPDAATMRRIAADVGYSETAFIAPSAGRSRTVRYYSPEDEVSFCGHATIASGVLLGRLEGAGRYRLATAVGEVPVYVRREGEHFVASLTSVEPRDEKPGDALLEGALAALRWSPADLDPGIPPAKAYAGAWHLVLAAATAERLAALDYDFDALKTLMLGHDLTTLQLVWREREDLFHARDPFPVGGVVEDPATGAAAAALGGYLRAARLLRVPGMFRIRQGEAMGRPSLLSVDVPAAGGIVVSGTAVPIGQE